MKLIDRIWRTLRAWLLIEVEAGREPELFPPYEREALERDLAEIKQRAITAVGQRNRLRRMVRDDRKRAARIETEVRKARERGDEERAKQLLVESGQIEGAITGLQRELERAEQEVRAVTDGELRALEAEIRRRAAERLEQIAGWRRFRAPWDRLPGNVLRDPPAPPPVWEVLAGVLLLLGVLVWLAWCVS